MMTKELLEALTDLGVEVITEEFEVEALEIEVERDRRDVGH
jgi:hypothetical protein